MPDNGHATHRPEIAATIALLERIIHARPDRKVREQFRDHPARSAVLAIAGAGLIALAIGIRTFRRRA